MKWFLLLFALSWIAISAPALLRMRALLRHTTLVEAWGWGVAAFATWTVTFATTDLLGWVRGGWADQLWFASAVMALSPLIAALGARRPGSRVWSVFVVLPLMIVLFLPAITAWGRDLKPAPLQLEAPILLGYGLILLMGAGNYIPTRFFVSAVFIVIACLFNVLTLSYRQWFDFDPWTYRVLATTAGALGVVVASFRLNEATHTATVPLERVWIDFCDIFGLVWARRIANRLNEAAQNENWPLRFHPQVIVPADPAKPTAAGAHAQQIEQALRWLLRRFVDPEWIDERLRDGADAISAYDQR